MQKLKAKNAKIEDKVDLEKMKKKYVEQIQFGSQMKEKILMINYLDETLQLGFKDSLPGHQQELLS